MWWYGQWKCVCTKTKVSKYGQSYYQQNKDKVNEASKRNYSANKEWVQERTKKWYATNRERCRAVAMENLYGLSVDQFKLLYHHQRGVCGLRDCSTPLPEGLGAHIDHDYATGLVRGLLCSDCNRKEGLLRKLIGRIPTFQEYWRSPPAQQLGLHCIGSKFKKTLGGATPKHIH